MKADEAPDEKEIDSYMMIVRSLLDKESVVDDSTIDRCINDLRIIRYFDDVAAERVKKKILSIYGHTLDVGSMIINSEHKAWYLARTRDTQMQYTERNLKYLQSERGLSPDIVSKLNDITDEIMDGFGDPKSGPFSVRGLVMGDVQSGKTNTYTTLSCKAADVGYKVIILLTGTLEILRQQTQRRLDEGLVGSESAILIKADTSRKPVGVGKINYLPFAVFTSTDNDFKSTIASQVNVPITDLQIPVLLVVKKNKKILNNLSDWLRTRSGPNRVLEAPLLLVDDEADNASINTASDPDEVTAINRGIRKILNLFTKSTYVGFTATPYANIFINPDEKEDLYPHEFIYCLRAANNYIGPSSMYNENGNHRFMLRKIETATCDGVDIGLPEIPYKHGKDFRIKILPDSLIEAINCFLISCTIREMQGYGKSHMSMLVNVSRFTNVQESARELIANYIFGVKSSLELNSKLPESDSLKDKNICSIKNTWIREYKDIGYEWMDIQMRLECAVKPIAVRSVNQKNGPKNLNYNDNPDGLRVIAVGGNSLSRGLTLEGLSQSYFYRISSNYDTLMQMGRWFGYRDDYDKLCRVWMTQDSIDWYNQISEATEELKDEFHLMRDLNKTPDDFGFRVRNDINGLLITARNKMRSAGEAYITKSLNGSLIWTSKVYVDPHIVDENNMALQEWIKRLNDLSQPLVNEFMGGNRVWPSVPGDLIADFLEMYKYPKLGNVLFDHEAVIRMIRDGQLDSNWDVAIQHGTGMVSKTLESAGLGSIKTARRTSFTPKEEGTIRFNSSALITPQNLREGICIDSIREGTITKGEWKAEIEELESKYKSALSKEEIERVESKGGEFNFPAKAYLNTEKRRPLFLIYVLDIYDEKDGTEDSDKERIRAMLEGRTPIGIAMGFPKYDFYNGNDRLAIKYRTSVIYDRLGGNGDLDEIEGD